MKARIVILGGDGIGPEVVAEGVRCLQALGERQGHEFELTEALFGGAAIDAHGDPLPPATLQACLRSQAVLLGAVGGPKWSTPQIKVRPEAGLLRLRRELGVYANLRPVSVHPALTEASPLKAAVLQGVDLIFVRELTGGIYFGEKHRDARHGPRCVHLHGRRGGARDARCGADRARAAPQDHLDRQIEHAWKPRACGVRWWNA